MIKKRFYSIISHTHWDREWYLPLEQFRIRLVDLMDNLLDILERDGKFRFHLDAQTIVLDDYLMIRPEKKEVICHYVSTGRLLIGPWYVQNDFHLTSGEATVRNLMIGIKKAENYGHCTTIGYAADQFGLCSQLPQILNGFDIDTCIFGRGFSRGDRQFYWKAPNGSRVLCEHMFSWYNNLQRLPEDPQNALSFIRKRGNDCEERGGSTGCLLMNGVDHLEAQENLTGIISHIQPLLQENETLCQDTMPEYMNRLKNEIFTDKLQLHEYEGEFRDGGQNYILTGTLSSRIHLKKKNALIQAEIERNFEPGYALLDMLRLKHYPLGYSDYLWTTLIQNHPHDSICGCSTEAVHDHMMDRFYRLEENLEELKTRADQEYLRHVDRSNIPSNAFLIMCVNNSLYPYSGILEAAIEIPTEEDSGGFTLTDNHGKQIPFEVQGIEQNICKQVLSPINLPGKKMINRYNIAFKEHHLEGLSRKIFICSPTDNILTVTQNTRKYSRIMENEYLKVYINKNGTVNLTDKNSNKTYNNILYFEDNADRGTVYSYEYGLEDETFRSLDCNAKITVQKNTKLIQSRRILTKIKVTRDIAKGEIPIEMILTLKAGSKQLDITVNVENRLPNHRLRIMIPTDLSGDTNYAGQPFDVITRPKVSKQADDENHPNTEFVGIDGESCGIAILNEGLYEYEQLTDEHNTLALTLLRCIGRISGNWENQNHLADCWIVPKAQMTGMHSAHLSVYPYTGDHTDAGVVHKAASFITAPYTAVQHWDYNKFVGGSPFVQSSDIPLVFYRPLENPDIVLPLKKTFVQLSQSTENAMMLSAFKGAEDKNGVILRLYNTISQDVNFNLSFDFNLKEAYLTNMNETNISQLPIQKGTTVSLFAKGKEVITVRIILA